jgi:hypothetical protein
MANMSQMYASGPSIVLPRDVPVEIQDKIRPNGVIANAKSSAGYENLTFDELNSIERDRRNLLLRVSISLTSSLIQCTFSVFSSPTT